MADEPEHTPADETPNADAASPPKSEATPPWRRQLDESLGDLKTMAGDIRERLGRAGETAKAGAKEEWEKLEPQIKTGIRTAEEKLVEATDEAVEQLKGLFGSLKGKLENLRDKLG